MARNTHAFKIGDIIEEINNDSQDKHIVILQVLTQPCRYCAQLIITGELLKDVYLPKRLYRKVKQ